jgi:hypothetical protein
MKKGDVIVIADDDDDVVRVSVSRNHVTVTLCTEELSPGVSIYSSPSYHPGETVWGGMDDQHNTWSGPS